MDPKSQRVKLNDGHFIPVLGFGTYAPPEVTVAVVGRDINSSGFILIFGKSNTVM